METIAEFYQGRSVLLTGVTGLLGKVILEKLLRSCPGIKHIYVLIRPTWSLDPNNRLQEIWSLPLFKRLKLCQGGFQAKVSAVDGDLKYDSLGISASDLKTLQDEVSIIIHAAAATRANERLNIAVDTNVLGTRGMAHLAKNLPKVEAFVHVSMAHANCPRRVIEEKIYPPPMTMDDIRSKIKGMDDMTLANKTAGLLGRFHNTHALTKCIGEWTLQRERGSVPCAIIRPSFLTATAIEPKAGWLESRTGISENFVSVAHGILPAVRVKNNVHVDVVPVDMCANAIITLARHLATEKPMDIAVYNFTNTSTNRVTAQKLMEDAANYYENFPVIQCKGHPQIYVTHNSLVRYVLNDMLQYWKMAIIDLFIPFHIKKPTMKWRQARANAIARSFEFYATEEWVFRNGNVKKLLATLQGMDQMHFNFDLGSIDWDVYLAKYMEGVRVHLIKESWMDLPHARDFIGRWQWLSRLQRLSLLVFVAGLLWRRLSVMPQLLLQLLSQLQQSLGALSNPSMLP